MISDIEATEGHLESKENFNHGMQEAPCPACPHWNATEFSAYDRSLVQGFADGLIAVIGHDSKDNHLHPSKEIFTKELAMQASKDVVFFSERETIIMFTAMTDE